MGGGLSCRSFGARREVHVRLGFVVNAGRRLYRLRRWTSAPEYAYPRSGWGSGREFALGSSSEQTSCSYRSPTQNSDPGWVWAENVVGTEASVRRRCLPSECRSRSESSGSAGEQRRRSYTDFQVCRIADFQIGAWSLDIFQRSPLGQTIRPKGLYHRSRGQRPRTMAPKPSSP